MWFLVALLFFLLWILAKSANSAVGKENYAKGYSDGRHELIESILADLEKAPLTSKAFKKYVNKVESEEVVESQPVKEGMSATGFVAMADDTQTSDDNIAAQPVLVVQQAVRREPQPHVPTRSKAEQTNRNLNILLYTASFLIIAAAAAFIATNTPAVVRLSGLWFIITVFYIAGLVIHAKAAYLRPAATAFVGTGLALIPFAGIALSQLGGLSGGWAWFITSIVGIISYAIATIRLSSNIVGYLTIAFSLSFAASSVAVISGPVVLYFVVLIVVSLLFHLAAHLKPSWVPEIFQKPIEQTGHLLTPLTLLGSIMAYGTMTVASYQIVFWVATLYYLVIWFTDRSYVYEIAVRILLTIAVFISAFDAVAYDLDLSLWIWLTVVAAHLFYSFIRVTASKSNGKTETIWYWVLTTLLVATLLYWMAVERAQAGLIAQVGVIAISSLAMAWRVRSVYVAIPALGASIVLPFIIGRWPSDELLSIQWMTYVFIVMAAAALYGYKLLKNRSKYVVNYIKTAFWLYFAVALLLSFKQDTEQAIGLSSLMMAILVFAASYVYRLWFIELLSAILVLVGVNIFVSESSVPSEWLAVATIAITGFIYALLACVHHVLREVRRRDMMITSSLVIGASLVTGVLVQSNDVKIVSTTLLIVLALSSLLVRVRSKNSFLQQLFAIAYVVYPILSLVTVLGLGAGWYALVFAVIAGVLWLASYLERGPVLIVFGDIALVGFLTSVWIWLKLDTAWIFFGVAWLAAILFYVSYLLFTTRFKDSDRMLIQFIFTWIALLPPALYYIWVYGDYAYVAAATVAFLGGTLIVHGLVMKQRSYSEAGIYVATIGAQRITGLLLPELNMVFYGHWWALIVSLVAYWRRFEPYFVRRLVVSMGIITFSTGVMALTNGGMYQLLFLVEHVMLLVIGALKRTSWALWWGLVATILAVLFFLRSSLFLSLLFLGLTLLGIVVWRLAKAQKKN